jgi:formate dehydrogenase subunit delta
LTTGKIEKLVHTANQIAENFSAMPEAEAIAGAATHLRLYWTPKMVREIIAFADQGRPGLNTIAARAVQSLKETVAAG